MMCGFHADGAIGNNMAQVSFHVIKWMPTFVAVVVSRNGDANNLAFQRLDGDMALELGFIPCNEEFLFSSSVV